jgi:SsrA-binding protein
MSGSAKAKLNRAIVAQNRKARHNYFIEDTLECGLMLKGTEVKSLREGKGGLVDAYAAEEDGELWLVNAYIPDYGSRGYATHEERRPRKLLAKRREIAKLIGQIREKGFTLVPLAIYFNERGIAKAEIGLAKGKKQYDKRDTDKKRDWDRQKARLLREKG